MLDKFLKPQDEQFLFFFFQIITLDFLLFMSFSTFSSCQKSQQHWVYFSRRGASVSQNSDHYGLMCR